VGEGLLSRTRSASHIPIINIMAIITRRSYKTNKLLWTLQWGRGGEGNKTGSLEGKQVECDEKGDDKGKWEEKT